MPPTLRSFKARLRPILGAACLFIVGVSASARAEHRGAPPTKPPPAARTTEPPRAKPAAPPAQPARQPEAPAKPPVTPQRPPPKPPAPAQPPAQTPPQPFAAQYGWSYYRRLPAELLLGIGDVSYRDRHRSRHHEFISVLDASGYWRPFRYFAWGFNIQFTLNHPTVPKVDEEGKRDAELWGLGLKFAVPMRRFRVGMAHGIGGISRRTKAELASNPADTNSHAYIAHHTNLVLSYGFGGFVELFAMAQANRLSAKWERETGYERWGSMFLIGIGFAGYGQAQAHAQANVSGQ